MKCCIACPYCSALLELVGELRLKQPPPAPSSGERRGSALARFDLTPRQYQAAELLLLGMTNPQMARELGVSVQVVKNYNYKIFDKVGCGNRAEFISMVLGGGS